MAKQIKAIKCPQCGSTQKTLIKEDSYKCDNCGTEYFLDNDDINVNINHNVNPHSSPSIKPTYIVISVILIAIFFFSILLAGMCSTKSRNTNSSYGAYQSSTVKEENLNSYKDSYTTTHLVSANNKAIAFSIVKREYGKMFSEDKRNGYYFIFRDVTTNKVLKAEKIEQSKIEHKYQYLPSMNKHYIILNKRYIHEINSAELSFKDVTTDIFSKHAEFESGIASAEFIYAPRGDGFQVMTNMGKELYFCPKIDKIYSKDDFFARSHEFNTLLPNAKDETYYVFTRSSDDYPDEPIQLLRITYKYNNGGPEDKEENPQWHKRYPYSGIIYSNTPYKKELIDKSWHRVTDFNDVTPGRIYFAPSVLYSDKEHILIKFKANAAPDAPSSIQLLKTNGDIVWTLAHENSFRSDGLIIKTDKYYVIKTLAKTILLIDANGKNSKEIELPES